MSEQYDPRQPYGGQQQPGNTPPPQQPYSGYNQQPQQQPYQSPQPMYNQPQPPNYNQPTYPAQQPYQQGQNPQQGYNNATPYYAQQPKKKGGFPIWLLFVLIPVVIIVIAIVLLVTVFNGAKTAVTTAATASAQTVSVASTQISGDVNTSVTKNPTLASGLPMTTPNVNVPAKSTTAPAGKATTAPAKGTTAPANNPTSAPGNGNAPTNVAFPTFPGMSELSLSDDVNKQIAEELASQAPGSAIKIYGSDKTVAELSAGVDKAMLSAGYASIIPGMGGMMGQSDSFVGIYSKAGAPDIFLVLTNPQTAGVDESDPSVAGQLQGKNSILLAIATTSGGFGGMGGLGGLLTPTTKP